MCLAAGEKFDFHVINMRFVKPLDEQIIDKLVEDCELIITVEENVVEGGAGSAVNELVAKRGGKGNVRELWSPRQIDSAWLRGRYAERRRIDRAGAN